MAQLLDLAKVENWTMVASKEHLGLIPEITEQEYQAWQELSSYADHSIRERRLFNALDRKLRWKAIREK